MITQSDVGVASIRAEVAAVFQTYERALMAGDAATLDAMFWASEDTIRFGVADRQHGISALVAWRGTQGPLPGRELAETQISVFGPDTAVVTTLFGYPARPFEGRQSQTWVRFTEGWRIVAAHVSEVSTHEQRAAAPSA